MHGDGGIIAGSAAHHGDILVRTLMFDSAATAGTAFPPQTHELQLSGR
jgi:hypothetical protein